MTVWPGSLKRSLNPDDLRKTLSGERRPYSQRRDGEWRDEIKKKTIDFMTRDRVTVKTEQPKLKEWFN